MTSQSLPPGARTAAEARTAAGTRIASGARVRARTPTRTRATTEPRTAADARTPPGPRTPSPRSGIPPSRAGVPPPGARTPADAGPAPRADTRTPSGVPEAGAVQLASFGPPRVLAGLEQVRRLDRATHLRVHGSPPPLRAGELLELAELTGLRGRGGAGFPLARKLRAVLHTAARRGARTAVVVNACEGEPASLKDTALLLHTPHLVLDGALLAAEALGAREVCVGVTRRDVASSVQEALAARGTEAARARVRVALLPDRYVTGESSALVNGLGQAPALPSGSRREHVSDAGVGGAPTLLCNAETFAQLALVARLGPTGFRAKGLPAEPGTVLLTVAGSRVLETPTGVPLAYLLELCGTPPGQGVLVGGYHGGWLGPHAARAARVSRESLESLGGTLGAGAVLPLPEETCPVGETVRVAHWLARESAGQCGPCVLGLPALAAELERAAEGAGSSAALDSVRRRARALAGRGACTHPDGTARFVTSALSAFADDYAAHAAGRPCGRPVLGSLPAPGVPLSSPSAPARDTARLVVNWALCQGHGLCAGVVPGLVQLSPDGYPTHSSIPVPAHLRRDAQRAVRRCPALALRVEG
ncbi:NADH-ubiquinone oxidoreductase-F iron-sulfur binding region domain-containing protein [Streptomyces iconiensis]|uniref:NADH-ubiquinone oxidoreductase-F iron-sulfur binding region domain-containing protein n=1 Tax=Streptomyces iconiensis TaxID=1384038 RepID=A0ABT6ZUA8_9ACTN|nr:NADH-quinone oxidoreductase subunit NuoF family protein [Streptomyces iconiensis]MDJ1132399.1 NADH-ubiquinone oxidoreductase-F iron-sulfur binding region domain-containing protein [Streptomyces iconiensis]